MKILLTRPREQSEAIASEFRSEGIGVWIEPMLTIVPKLEASIDPSDYKALLVTSVNGAETLAKVTENRESVLYAVGEVTKASLIRNGFRNVCSANGNVEDLLETVAQRENPGSGKILHVGGDNLAGNLVERLRLRGFSASHFIIYRSVASEYLSNELISLLKGNKIDGVVFFSPRTAKVFVSLAEKASCEKALLSMTAFCLSASVCKAVQPRAWGHLVVSDRSTGPGLVSAVIASK